MKWNEMKFKQGGIDTVDRQREFFHKITYSNGSLPYILFYPSCKNTYRYILRELKLELELGMSKVP